VTLDGKPLPVSASGDLTNSGARSEKPTIATNISAPDTLMLPQALPARLGLFQVVSACGRKSSWRVGKRLVNRKAMS
jgi:hypothetical protein